MSQTKKVSDAILLYRIEDGLDEDGVSLVMRRFVDWIDPDDANRLAERYSSIYDERA